MRVKHEQTHDDHCKQGYDFCRGEDITDFCSSSNSANVDERQQADQCGKNQRTREWIFGVRPEFAQVDYEQVGIGRRSCNLSQPQHPCSLNAHEPSKGNAGVEVRATGLLKARGHFREASHNHAHAGTGGENGVWTEIADESSDRRGQPEDATADDGINHQRDQAPATDGADEATVRMISRRRFHARAFVP